MGNRYWQICSSGSRHRLFTEFIRDHIAKVDANIAEQVIIQYGSSVNASNAAELFAQPDIDGALVGGASLKADAFAVIVKSCSRSG